jgi:hypothetical protein
MANPEDLLEQVMDKQTFIQFVQALADERARAQAIEQANPNIYRVDGALGWKNSDIPGFLDAALECSIAQPLTDSEPEPSWKMFAEFLYFGKIYE